MNTKVPLPRKGCQGKKRGNEGDVHQICEKLVDTPLPKRIPWGKSPLVRGDLIPNQIKKPVLNFFRTGFFDLSYF